MAKTKGTGEQAKSEELQSKDAMRFGPWNPQPYEAMRAAIQQAAGIGWMQLIAAAIGKILAQILGGLTGQTRQPPAPGGTGQPVPPASTPGPFLSQLLAELLSFLQGSLTGQGQGQGQNPLPNWPGVPTGSPQGQNLPGGVQAASGAQAGQTASQPGPNAPEGQPGPSEGQSNEVK